jgi:hypothetical protein
MKILIVNLGVLALLSTFSSCDIFDKAGDITFETEVPLYFYVNETDINETGKTYTGVQLLDLTDDPDVAKYANKIKDVKVKKVSYYVYALNKTGVNFSGGSLMISSNSKTIATLSNLSLTEGAKGDFSIDASGFSELSANLKDTKSEVIKLQGTLSKTPVSFEVECRFHVAVTANAL